jgi:hypothetical protein
MRVGGVGLTRLSSQPHIYLRGRIPRSTNNNRHEQEQRCFLAELLPPLYIPIKRYGLRLMCRACCCSVASASRPPNPAADELSSAHLRGMCDCVAEAAFIATSNIRQPRRYTCDLCSLGSFGNARARTLCCVADVRG